ncbi:MAG: leucine-rich repeat protein [Clostridia bacterium]|nr:leucine-rich repeat protein [Clostridia bacterium]
MQKKGFIAVLSAIVLMIIASISLVLAVGHNASAAKIENRIIVLDEWDDFNINDNGVLSGFSNRTWNFLSSHGCWSSCGAFGPSEDGDWDGVDLYIPEGVKEIGGWALANWEGGDTAINSVHLPDSLEKIDEHAFDGVNRPVNIIIPKNVKEIGRYAFAYCSGLQDSQIPISVIEMGDGIFSNCENLNRIYCEIETKLDGWDESWKYSCDAEVVWDCNKTITFDTDGGNNVADQTVCVDSLVTKPADPTKEGYEFKGWFDNNGDEYDFTTPVTADMTLTAQWEAIPVTPEPSNPEQPTTPENLEQPTTPDTDTETVTAGSKNGFNIGAAIGGGLVAGLGTISAIAATVIARRRHK